MHVSFILEAGGRCRAESPNGLVDIITYDVQEIPNMDKGIPTIAVAKKKVISGHFEVINIVYE